MQSNGVLMIRCESDIRGRADRCARPIEKMENENRKRLVGETSQGRSDRVESRFRSSVVCALLAADFIKQRTVARKSSADLSIDGVAGSRYHWRMPGGKQSMKVCTRVILRSRSVKTLSKLYLRIGAATELHSAAANSTQRARAADGDSRVHAIIL